MRRPLRRRSPSRCTGPSDVWYREPMAESRRGLLKKTLGGAALPPGDAKDLKQLLALFDNALFSFVSGGPARPFTQLSASEQDEHLRAWQTSRLAIKRTGFQAMKRLTCAIYFSSPSTFASVG